VSNILPQGLATLVNYPEISLELFQHTVSTLPLLRIFSVFLSAAVSSFWILIAHSIAKSLSTAVKSRRSLCNITSVDLRITAIIPTSFPELKLLRLTISKLLSSKNVEEVIVVDNSPTPRPYTELISMQPRYPKFIYIKLFSIPTGHCPKPYACYIGYAVSKGRILLFTDDDTLIEASSAETLACTALRKNALASPVPRFACTSTMCRMLETVITTLVHGLVGLDKAVRGKYPWFYGCCWAIPRSLYENLGTHKQVLGTIVEDAMLARIALAKNIKIVFIQGLEVSTYWHNSLKNCVEALLRNLIPFIDKKTLLTLFSLLLVAYASPLILEVLGYLSRDLCICLAGLFLYVAASYAHVHATRLNNYRAYYLLTHVVGGTVLFVTLLLSTPRTRFVTWRGRAIETTKRYCKCVSP